MKIQLHVICTHMVDFAHPVTYIYIGSLCELIYLLYTTGFCSITVCFIPLCHGVLEANNSSFYKYIKYFLSFLTTVIWTGTYVK